MQTRHSLALVLLLILAAGACQQAPSLADRWTPLELGEHFEATCVAGIHAGGMGRFAEPELDPAADEPDASRRQILIRSWLLRLDPVSAAHLLPGLGRQGVEGAQLISVDSIETLLEELTEGGGADLLTAPSVLCLNGQIATVAQLNQLAFFESFQVNRNAQGAIVDPKVGILEDGMQLRFRAPPTRARRGSFSDSRRQSRPSSTRSRAGGCTTAG